MTEARLTWSIWQVLLSDFAWAFTQRGFHRFVEWITAMALNVEEHTITQSVLALEQPAAWKALESFAEYGSWHEDRVTRTLTRLVATAPGRIWHGYYVSAVDDTKLHRSSPHVWGTCTFHEYTARCPNRATTVLAHNWVVLGALLHEPEMPAWFLPISGQLYFRKTQLPVGPDGIVKFHTKCELAVELFREQASVTTGKHLAVLDGGYALGTVVRPLVLPEYGAPRIDFLTRLRRDARLFELPLSPEECPAGKRGRKPRWGPRLEPPCQGGRWKTKWQVGTAFVYGRQRTIRWKEIICLWRVLGWEVPVKAIIAHAEGYKQRFTLVTSAVELTGLEMVELFAARFRQEDGFRDMKQRLGWEECRAWTAKPIQRTSQAQWVTMSLLRMLQFRLEASRETGWWLRPPWNKNKNRPSVLDAERLMRRHRAQIQQFLSKWERTEGKTEGDMA